MNYICFDRVEYWKATKRTWCPYCKEFFLDKPATRRSHETSLKHRTLLRKHVDVLYTKGAQLDLTAIPAEKARFYDDGAPKEKVDGGVEDGAELVFGGSSKKSKLAQHVQTLPLETSLESLNEFNFLNNPKHSPKLPSSQFEEPVFGPWVPLEEKAPLALPQPTVESSLQRGLPLRAPHSKPKKNAKKLTLQLNMPEDFLTKDQIDMVNLLENAASNVERDVPTVEKVKDINVQSVSEALFCEQARAEGPEAPVKLSIIAGKSFAHKKKFSRKA